MSVSDFTPGQRRTVIGMTIAVVVVLAILAGFVVTFTQSLESRSPVATIVLASSTSTPAPTPPPSAPSLPEEGILPQVRAARLFEQIAHQAEMLRGLSPRAEVPLSFLDEREMTVLLRRLYAERDPEGEALPYTLLGLLPDTPATIRPRPVAGIYVPEQEQLYISIDLHGSGADAQALLARAYTNALQDQRFDQGALGARATTTDATLAVRALLEGDALLLTALYRYQNLEATDWTHLMELVEAEQPDYGEKLGQIEAWGRLQRFPYWEGRHFTTLLFQTGGWEAINLAYTDPPRSTEQVLHPERYLEEREAPSQIVVPDLTDDLGVGWTTLHRDTLGEFVIGLYLDEQLPEETAWQAADGWDGDAFVTWEHEDGDQVLVWRTIWANTAEAAEFERAMAAVVPQRYLPAWPLDPPLGSVGEWWETDTGAVYICRAARYVTFVRAPDVNALVNVVEVLP